MAAVSFMRNSSSGRGQLAPVSAFEQSDDYRLRQCIEVQIEADDGGRCVRFDVELVGLHGEYGEEIAVRMIARRRAWAAVTGGTEIGAGLQRARRQRTAGIAGAESEFAHGRRDIDDQPMPKARPGRRVRIVAGDGEAF